MVIHPGAAAILPVLPDGRLLFVRQYRPAVESPLLEIPAGKIEPGETPFDCARRELREETGYATSIWEPLVACYTSPGVSTERITLYRARSVRRTAGETAGEIEEICTLTPSEALACVDRGEIADAKTILAITLHAAKGS